MPKVTISQASKLTGKARTTIRAHIKKGVLSSEKDNTNRRVIDVSELERVYGSVNMNTPLAGVEQSGAMLQTCTIDTPSIFQEKEAFLKREIDLLREQLEEAKEREKKLLGLVEKQTLLLEHQKKPFWKRLAG